MTLVPGFYTMSVMKHRCADRSYTHDIWEVLSINGAHAVIKSATARYSHSFGFEPEVVNIAEYDWYPSGDMLPQFIDHCSPDLAAKLKVKS